MSWKIKSWSNHYIYSSISPTKKYIRCGNEKKKVEVILRLQAILSHIYKFTWHKRCSGVCNDQQDIRSSTFKVLSLQNTLSIESANLRITMIQEIELELMEANLSVQKYIVVKSCILPMKIFILIFLSREIIAENSLPFNLMV